MKYWYTLGVLQRNNCYFDVSEHITKSTQFVVIIEILIDMLTEIC